MARRSTVLLLVGFVLVVGGAAVGIWDDPSVQACHDTYDDRAEVVDCEDSFTGVVRYGSLLAVVTGVGLAAQHFYNPVR